jgi:hypothetical protein
VRGWSAIVGGQLLSREAVRRSRSAQDGGDEAGGRMAWADVREVLGSRQRCLVGGERRWGVVALGGAVFGVELRQSERGWSGGP